MSKSLNQVTQYLIANEIEYELRKTDQIARTAQEAADGIGCHLNQIVKSIIFSAPSSDNLVLFLTAGGNFVDVHKVESLLGFTLQKADAQIIRFQTGFVIGSVPPFAHKEELAVYMDPELLNHSLIWAAVGTPFHLFSINSEVLLATTKAKTLNSVIPARVFSVGFLHYPQTN
ncbi:MAG: YbaK/EbsC family protein [Rhodobacteraceae bacterium]|nr:YbaK/EbsC family protein [Paracoccaceae bacterium]